jgi:hypothetical protein
MRHERFLLAEAPTLPLPMCTWPTSCPCQLQLHADRRSGRRREDENEFGGDRRERRRSQGRRATDAPNSTDPMESFEKKRQ